MTVAEHLPALTQENAELRGAKAEKNTLKAEAEAVQAIPAGAPQARSDPWAKTKRKKKRGPPEVDNPASKAAKKDATEPVGVEKAKEISEAGKDSEWGMQGFRAGLRVHYSATSKAVALIPLALGSVHRVHC